MKITSQGRAHAVRYLTDTGGNPVLPNPDSPAPDDPVDVALDADAFVPIAPPTSSAFIQAHHLETADTEGGWENFLDDAPTPGNVMVVGYTQRGWNGDIGAGGILVDGDGWTLIDVATCGPGNGGYVGLWWRLVEFGDVGHVSITKQASNAAGGWIAEFAMGALLDSVTDGPTGGSTTYTGPSITATGTDQIAISNAIQSTNSTVINGDGTATVIAAENIAGGSVGPSYIGQYRIGGPGAEDFDASTSDAQQWGSVVALFDSVGTDVIQVPAPLTVDGDDATYEVSSLEEEVRLDIGNAQRLTSARLLIGFTSSGSKTVHLWASNDPDMAGAVDVTSEVFTATGGFTGDEVIFTIADTTAYRYWEFRGPVTDTRTYTVEMFAFQQSFDLSGYQLLSEKGDPNGYASLDSGGLVPVAQLPFIEDLATAETDDTLVLAPDGAGGVEFRAETGGGGSALTVKDEGSTLDTAVTSIDFTGAGVVATNVSHAVTVTISGGGGGGSSMPNVVQSQFSGTAISSMTVTAPVSGHTCFLYIDAFNVADPTSITQTNVTWTKIVSVSAGAKYSLWVGVVSGTGGTSITITHANSFLSAFFIEVEDSLSGTLGTSGSGSLQSTITTAAAPGAGNLVAICAGTDNTLKVDGLFSSLPVAGFSGGITFIGVCYSQGYPVSAFGYAANTNTAADPGTIVIAEVT